MQKGEKIGFTELSFTFLFGFFDIGKFLISLNVKTRKMFGERGANVFWKSCKSLNVFTKRRCTKCKLLLTSSEILPQLRDGCFQANPKMNVKITVFRFFVFQEDSLQLFLVMYSLLFLFSTLNFLSASFNVLSSFVSRASPIFLFYVFGNMTLVLPRIQLNSLWHSFVFPVASDDFQLPFMLSCWCSMQHVNAFFLSFANTSIVAWRVRVVHFGMSIR